MLDPDAYPPGPNGLAKLCEDRISELVGQRAALPRSEQQPINQQLQQVRQILDCCRTWAKA
jgi:hypothetical protein